MGGVVKCGELGIFGRPFKIHSFPVLYLKKAGLNFTEIVCPEGGTQQAERSQPET
jgi:hypothetical protein